jgi:phosphatidylglycerophosphate synthase
MSKYSLKDIYISYSQKKRWEKQFPANYYLVRPLSFLLTWIIIRITDRPERIVWFGFIVGITGCLFLLGFFYFGAWPGILLLISFSILDAVDGNIARVTGKITYYGKYMDSIVGEIIGSSYFICLGAGMMVSAFLNDASGTLPQGDMQSTLPFIAGTLAGISRALSTYIHSQYEHEHQHKQYMENNSKSNNISEEVKVSTFSGRWYYMIFVNMERLPTQILLFLVFQFFDRLQFFLYFMAIYYISKFVITFVFSSYRAARRLR